MTRSKRNRMRALILVAALSGWLLLALVIQPARQRIATLNRVVPEKQAVLLNLTEAGTEYRRLNQRLAGLQAQIAGQAGRTPSQNLAALLTQLDLAGHATITPGVARQYPRYLEIPLTLTLESLAPDQWTGLIDQVNRTAPFRIDRLTLTPGGAGRLSGELQLTVLTAAR